MLFGRESLIPVAIASIITVCILFASAIVLIETGLQSGKRPHQLAGKVAASLIRNPILVAPALGALYGATGLPVPESADRFLKLLGGAASPCALVVLGLFLAERREISAGDRGTSGLLTLAKLFLQPLLTWVLAYWVFCRAARARSHSGRAGRTAHRHRSVHAGGVLRAPCGGHLWNHPAFDHRLYT